MTAFDRRALLTAAMGAGALTLAGGGAVAQGAGISGISIDTRPLAAKGAGFIGRRIEPMLAAELATAFGGVRGGGPRLVVRIDGISFAAQASGSGFGLGFAGSDALEGVAMLVGPGGQVVGTYPITNTISATSGGAWYLPDNEQRRLLALSRNYAQWVRRAIGA